VIGLWSRVQKAQTQALLTPPPIPQLGEVEGEAQRKIAAFYTSIEWLNRCSSEIDNRIQGKTASAVMSWRSDTEYLASSWAYGLNLSGVAMARGAPRAVAVTSRHLVSTKHYGWHPWPGQTLNFLTMDNRVIARVVDQVKYLGSSNNSVIDTDVAVIRLAEDLPGSISPLKLITPDGLADVAQYMCPVLRLDQENKALLVAASSYGKQYRGAGFIKPTSTSYETRIRPYANFYEDMVTGDSTSSSIIIYKDQFGITPFLLSQVTYGGVGKGPNHSSLAAEIQDVINGFGDTGTKYKLVFGPYEYVGHTAPRCTVSSTRISNTGNCSITVQGSGDSTNGNPQILPNSVSSWTRAGQVWSGTASCSRQASTIFTAQLSGPGGTGPVCESGEVKPVITLPGCTLSASRQGTTNSCSLSVTRTQGNVTGNPSLTPASPISWTKAGDVWSATAPCSNQTDTAFSATLSGPDGVGSACTATVRALYTPPTCSLTAARVGSTDSCQLTLTAGGSFDTSNSPVFSSASLGTWSGNRWTGSRSCAINQSTTFTATVNGYGGASVTCQSSVIPPVPPACRLNVTRNGTGDTCTYTITSTSPVGTITKLVNTLDGNAFYSGGFDWNNSSELTRTNPSFGCSASKSFDFKAVIEGPGGQATCSSPRVEAIPKPSCSMTAAREGSTSQCNIVVKRTSGISVGYPSVSPAAPATWVTGTDNWSGKASCSTSSSTVFSASLSGPGGTGIVCSAAAVPGLNVAPSCRFSAQRRKTTSVCNVSVSITGQSTGAPLMRPIPISKWTQTSNGWSSTAKCIPGKITNFNVTVTGPYGKGYCGGAIK